MGGQRQNVSSHFHRFMSYDMLNTNISNLANTCRDHVLRQKYRLSTINHLTLVLRQYTNQISVLAFGHPNDRVYVDDSPDTSIANHWTRDVHQTLTDGSRVYHRTRSTSPPMFMQEMFHRIKPIDMAHHRMKKQIAAD